jgi:hypothetical protein
VTGAGKFIDHHFIALAVLKYERCAPVVDPHMLPLQGSDLLRSPAGLEQHAQHGIVASAFYVSLVNPLQACQSFFAERIPQCDESAR